MAKDPKGKERKVKDPKVLMRTTPKITTGRHGRRFHAPRAPAGFTTDPPGFQTEKDPRGKGSNRWFDLPAPTGTPPYHLDLASVLSKEAVQKIVDRKRLVFHSVGDTGGVNTTTYQQHVTTYMELDFSDDDPDGANPAFFYHWVTSSITMGKSPTITGSSTSLICITRRPSSPSPVTTTAMWTPTTCTTSRQTR